MRNLSVLIALSIAIPASAQAQSSNTSSNSSSNNGVVRERTVDTYCDGGYCTRTVERNVYRDGSDWKEHRDRDDDTRVDRQRLHQLGSKNFDRNEDGRLASANTIELPTLTTGGEGG